MVNYVYGFNSSTHVYFLTVQKKSYLPGTLSIYLSRFLFFIYFTSNFVFYLFYVIHFYFPSIYSIFHLSFYLSIFLSFYYLSIFLPTIYLQCDAIRWEQLEILHFSRGDNFSTLDFILILKTPTRPY